MSSNRLLSALLSAFLAVLLWPAAANATITVGVVGTASASAAASVSTIAITPASNLGIGTVIELYSVQNSGTNNGCTGVTDSKGNAYTKELTDANPGIWSNTFYGVITAALTTSDTITVACGVTTVAKAAAAVYMTGVNTSSPYDATAASNNGTTTATATPSVSQGVANSQTDQAVIASGYIAVNGTNVLTDNFTNLIDFNDANTGDQIVMSYKILTGVTTAQTWAPTLNAARAYNFFLDPFKPAAAGATCNGGLLLRGFGGC